MECVTAERIDAVIKDSYYYEKSNKVIMCMLNLQNGTTVSGESNISKEDAFLVARDKVWMLENYLLAQQQFSRDELKSGELR